MTVAKRYKTSSRPATSLTLSRISKSAWRLDSTQQIHIPA